MKYIPLTQGKFTIVDDEDYEWLVQFKWYYAEGYARRHVGRGENRYIVRMHREIMGLPFKDPREIDHINGDRFDNRKENLRTCSTQENQHNVRSRGGTSIYKGVCWNTQTRKWKAQIAFHCYLVYLGLHDTEYDAACAYDAAAEWLFEDFAKTNF